MLLLKLSVHIISTSFNQLIILVSEFEQIIVNIKYLALD